MLTTFIVCGFFSCNQSNQIENKKILRICLDTDILSFDPRVSGGRKSQVVIGMLYEGLMRLDRHGNATSGIAERYEMSKDFMNCTFYLRNSRWSNGDPLTAHDFAAAWKEILEPTFDSNHALAFYTIKNAKAAKEGVVPSDQIGVKALDDNTLFVEFEHPAPFFVELTINPVFSPVYLKESGKEIVSNGPFILKKWKPKEGLSVVKNENYWDAKSIKIDGISVALIEDANTALLMYDQNELDIFGRPMIGFPFEAISEKREKGQLHTVPSNSLYWLLFNTEKPPFNSSKIRRAFSYAIDRYELTHKLLQGGEIPSTSILPMHMTLQQSPYFKDADFDEARKLFSEGLEELELTPSMLPKIQLTFCSSTTGEKTIAQLIQQQWMRAFDIQVELIGIERAVYTANAASGDFHIRSSTWYTFMDDPSYNMERFKTKCRENVTRWFDPRYQELIELAQNEKKPEVRKKYFNHAETILMEEMPVAPIYHDTYKYIKKEHVNGISISNLGQIDFRWIEMK